MKKLVLLLVLPVLLISLMACQGGKDDEGINVVVSIVPQQTFVKAVGGDLVNVTLMIPAGSSPATYEPSVQEMQNLAQADVYFAIGVPTENANIIDQVNAETTELVKLNDEVVKAYDERTLNGGRDPHIWLSVKRVIKMIEVIRDTFISLDSDHASIYTKNASSYIEELESLDTYIESAVSTMTYRGFIVYHPAFGYFADDYELSMYALENDGQEASAQTLANMITFAQENDIRTVFYQSEFSSTQAIALAEEINGKAVQLAPLSADYVNNMRSMIDAIIAANQN